jgi:hypothetical protein
MWRIAPAGGFAVELELEHHPVVAPEVELGNAREQHKRHLYLLEGIRD